MDVDRVPPPGGVNVKASRAGWGAAHRFHISDFRKSVRMGSVVKKRRKRMAKKKHRKLLRKTRHQRRNKK